MNKTERSLKTTAFGSLSPRESLSCLYLTISGYLWAQIYLAVENHLRSFLFHNFLWILSVNKSLHGFHIVILNVCAYVYKF